MTVLSVAYPLFPVRLDSGGGAEQILYLLDGAFVARGHRSIVVGAAGSEIHGELIESQAGVEQSPQQHLYAIEGVLARNDVDVIHFHGLDFASYLPKTSVPMLATLHLPLDWYPKSIFKQENLKLVCVSGTQAADTGLFVVSNGVDLDRYARRPKKNYLLWMGRICPEKGVHLALQVAHRTGRELILAGPVHEFESHQEYFRSRVQPLLDAKRQYLGPVTGNRKCQLLAEAACVLIPSLVAETSSLVAMEAISSGTPVVALASGALPEVVEDGISGFIVGSEEKMAAAVERVADLSPDACIATAARRFDSARMAAEYLRLYSGITTAQQ